MLGRIALVAASALGLVAASTASAETVLRVVPGSDLRNLDPIQTVTYVARNHGYLIYDTLFATDSKGEIRPQMVERFEKSADGMTWRFWLRSGLKWHDGADVTADDCVASVKRWGKRDALGRALMAAAASVEANDASSFTIKLAQPFGLVLEALGKPGSNVPFMMPARVAATDPAVQITETIGSGPFIFKRDEWRPGNKVVYVKNPAYVPRDEPADGLAGGKRVKVDRVEWLYIADQTTAIAALQNNEVDYVELPSLDLLKQLMEDKAIKVGAVGDRTDWAGVLRINHLQKPFDNPAIRRALIPLINQEDFLLAQGSPPGFYKKQCVAVFGCGTTYETEAGAELAKHPSIETARRMLKEAGYAGEPVIVLHAMDVWVNNIAAQVLVQKLRDAGINVDDQQMDLSTLLERRGKKEGWSLIPFFVSLFDLASPANHIYLAGNCDNVTPAWTCDQDITRLREAFLREPDLQARKQLAAETQVRIYDSVPFIPWGQFTYPPVYRASLRGVLPVGVPVYWNVEK